jgi:hypothetical protein
VCNESRRIREFLELAAVKRRYAKPRRSAQALSFAVSSTLCVGITKALPADHNYK